jgi:predicted nucleic acid-binding protein
LRAYLDSSFLVSLYSTDGNSDDAQLALESASAEFVITTLGRLETANALELRVFRKQISAVAARASVADLEGDLVNGVFELRGLPEEAFDRALQLSRQTSARLGTRTADLLHVAAALEMNADYLYSFDRQQRKLAHAVGLKLNRAPAL